MGGGTHWVFCTLFFGAAMLLVEPAWAADVSKAGKKRSNQQLEAHQRALFKNFDQNHNGQLSRKEFVGVILNSLFQNFDKNKNGKITKAEFMDYSRDKKLAKKEYPIMDMESKGYINAKDVYRNTALVERVKGEFKKLDRGNKGYVTLKDLPDLTPEN